MQAGAARPLIHTAALINQQASSIFHPHSLLDSGVMNKPSLVWEAFDAVAERGSHAALSLLHAEVHGRELRLAFRWTVIRS